MISTIATDIMDEIKRTWGKDVIVQTIIQDLLANPGSHLHYKWVNGHLIRKGRIVIGNDPMLHDKLITICHDSVIEGHFRVTITARRVESVFYLKTQQILMR